MEKQKLELQHTVVFVGMNISPPPNELAGKLAQMISAAESRHLKFKSISLPNPYAIRKNRLLGLLGKFGDYFLIMGKLLSIAFAMTESRTILHLLLPGRKTNGLRTCILIGRAFGRPVVMSVLKNSDRTILSGSLASCLVCYSKPSYETSRKHIPPSKLRYVSPTSIETQDKSVSRNPKQILFMAMPWRHEDLKRRGFFLIRDLANYLSKSGDQWTLTILNRTGKHSELLDHLKQSNENLLVNIVKDRVAKVSHHFSRSGMLLVPHLDAECPDPALSTIEALSCGCPVITTSFNGYHSEIRRSEAGIICKASALDFFNAVKLSSEKNYYFSNNAKQLVLKSFSQSEFLSEHRSIYKSFFTK